MNKATTLFTVCALMIAGYAGARIYEDHLVYGDAQPAPSTDQILASFDRDLNRQATPAGPVRREAIAVDPLYKEINEKLRSQTPSDDQIAASFERAFRAEQFKRDRIASSLLAEPIHVLINNASDAQQADSDLMLATIAKPHEPTP